MMARRPVITGNWKMNKTPAEAVAFVRELTPMIGDFQVILRMPSEHVDVGVVPRRLGFDQRSVP